MHILIVDDHDLVRDALALGLQVCGHDVDQAGSGAGALTAMNARRPDVLVTDLDMPGMSGFELIRATRRAYPDLPIVAMTGGGIGSTDVAETLAKPFTSNELLRAITAARAAA